MALNKKISLVMFDRQTSGKGTPAATRKYGIPLRSGNPVQVPISQKYEELTITSVAPPAAYRDEEGPVGVNFVTRAFPRSCGMLYKLVLGTASDTVTGASDPFVHTITLQNGMDYATFWGQVDTEFQQFSNCRVDSVALSWKGAAPCELAVSALGTTWLGYVASTAPSVDDSLQQSFFPAGGTFQLDTITSTPATASITGGTITIARGNMPIRLSASIEPNDIWPGTAIITYELDLIPNDSTLWRAMLSGSNSGTAITATPQYGSAHVLFTQGVTPARTLDITSPRISWDGDFPAVDPAGGPMEFKFTGTAVTPSAGQIITVVVNNSENAAAYGGS